MSSQDLKFGAKVLEQMPGKDLTPEKKQYWIENQRALGRALNEALVENELEFEKNQYGHAVFTVTGRYLTGAQEEARLKDNGYNLTRDVVMTFTSHGDKSYDDCHILEEGREYRVVIMPMDLDGLRESRLVELSEKFGYKVPKAGLMPRIREYISDQQLARMPAWQGISAIHEPIPIPKYKEPMRLCLHGGSNTRTFGALPVLGYESLSMQGVAFLES